MTVSKNTMMHRVNGSWAITLITTKDFTFLSIE